jgi:hypothetical protein
LQEQAEAARKQQDATLVVRLAPVSLAAVEQLVAPIGLGRGNPAAVLAMVAALRAAKEAMEVALVGLDMDTLQVFRDAASDKCRSAIAALDAMQEQKKRPTPEG